MLYSRQTSRPLQLLWMNIPTAHPPHPQHPARAPGASVPSQTPPSQAPPTPLQKTVAAPSTGAAMATWIPDPLRTGLARALPRSAFRHFVLLELPRQRRLQAPTGMDQELGFLWDRARGVEGSVCRLKSCSCDWQLHRDRSGASAPVVPRNALPLMFSLWMLSECMLHAVDHGCNPGLARSSTGGAPAPTVPCPPLALL